MGPYLREGVVIAAMFVVVKKKKGRVLGLVGPLS